MPRARDAIARLSLAEKVPLVAGVLILLVAASVSLAAYFETRHVARQAAHQHVVDVAQLIRTTAQRTGPQLVGAARAIATRPGVAEYVRAPDAAHQPAALAALLFRTGGGGSVMATEIRDSSGRILLTTNTAVQSAATDFPPVIAGTDSGSVGPLRIVGDSIVYPVSARVPGVAGAMVVEWRHATISATTSEQQRKLLGAGANLLLGNADGGFWTDQHRSVASPPVDLRQQQNPVEYTRVESEGPVVVAAVPLSGTPWIFAIELPLSEVLAPANRFLGTVLLIAFSLAALGALAAWWFARRLTTPLLELADAADSIAAGGRGAAVKIARRDELGRLMASFDSMSRQVHDARERMEDTVSERTRELHEALRRLEEAQESLVRREKLAILGQLAGGVGHELRNPLGVMSNAIYYLERVLESSPETVREYLQLLREQVALSTKIVGDLLDFARISPAHRHPILLRGLVDAQLRRLPEHETVCIDVDVSDSLPPVLVDGVHIGQVVFNLVTNAIQAVGEAGGHVTVTARLRAPAIVELRVADTGPGVAPELVDKIFEPLFTTKARGIGLGLAVSRALVLANTGDIAVLSEPGRGATFIVSLPAAPGEPS